MNPQQIIEKVLNKMRGFSYMLKRDILHKTIDLTISETEKAKDEEFKKILKLPKNSLIKDKDDWEYEQFRIRQQTAKEIFAEIEKSDLTIWENNGLVHAIKESKDWQHLKKKLGVEK